MIGLVPVILVLGAAGAHAGWNLAAKRAGGGIAFVWLCAVIGLALYAPFALLQLLVGTRQVSLAGVGFMLGSGALHAGYFSALQEGYATGDLSLVYPLARGTGPLLSVLAAVLFVGERASAVALIGAGMIVLAILSLSRGARHPESARAAGLAVLTGAFIAAYTIWDAHAVGALRQPVIAYFWGAESTRVLLLSAVVLRRRRAVRESWLTRRGSALAVGLLSPAAYILVLAALTQAPVIFVAPAREVSIVFGVLLGANVLGEGRAVQRALASVAILAGIVLLAVG